MYAIHRSTRQVNFTGSLVRTLMSSDDTGGAFCLQEFCSPPGRSTPRHMHDREEETIHLLEGSLDIEVGDEKISLNAGETILLPRKVPHRLTMTGDVPARYLALCIPAGFDQFVEACASAGETSCPPAPPSAEDIARLKSECTRFGITLFPPKP